MSRHVEAYGVPTLLVGNDFGSNSNYIFIHVMKARSLKARSWSDSKGAILSSFRLTASNFTISQVANSLFRISMALSKLCTHLSRRALVETRGQWRNWDDSRIFVQTWVRYTPNMLSQSGMRT